MAAPTAPTSTLICSEALQKAGYNSTTSQFSKLLTRATTYWMEEVKNDIAMSFTDQESLISSYVQVLTKGRSRYVFPTGFDSILSMKLMICNHYGTFGAGCTATAYNITPTAPAPDTAYPIGKEIILASDNTSTIIETYTGTTATVTNLVAAVPGYGETYYIVDRYVSLEQKQAWEFDREESPTLTGQPSAYSMFPEYNSSLVTQKTYTLWRSPDYSNKYAVMIRYYVDLATVDLTHSIMSELYYKYRNLFIQGVFVRALQDQDDTRYATEMQIYNNFLKQVSANAKYGNLGNNMACTVDN